MWFIHGFILDIVVINILPYLSAKVSDAQRADKFPWALGGYKGTLNKEKACNYLLSMALVCLNGMATFTAPNIHISGTLEQLSINDIQRIKASPR